MYFLTIFVIATLTATSLAKVALPSASSHPFRRISTEDASPSATFPSDSTSSTMEKVMLMRGGALHGDISSLDWRYFLAGGICAAASHGYTTPIDVVKTRMQAFPEKYNKGVIAAARDIIQEEGLRYLLTGLGPTVVGYGLEGALKFGCYESFKVIFQHVTPYKVFNFLLASVVAGAVASIVLCPMEEARIKMVGDKSWQKENVVSGILRLVRENGLFASFAGLPAMLSKQIPYTMGKQVSFDFFAGMFYALATSLALRNEDAKWLISIGAAFVSSVMACLFSQPGDMILTATYNNNNNGGSHGHSHGHGAKAPAIKTASSNSNSSNSALPPSFSTIVRSIYRQHGLAGFYLGLQARLAHVASIITFQLVLYDMIKMSLGLPVTGTH